MSAEHDQLMKCLSIALFDNSNHPDGPFLSQVFWNHLPAGIEEMPADEWYRMDREWWEKSSQTTK